MGQRRSAALLVSALGVTAAVSPAWASASAPGDAGAGRVPPFVFTSDRDGDPEIYVRTAAGKVRKLTANEVSDYGAVFSPDGSALAFVRGTPDGGGDQIWVMDADGGNQHQLTGPAVTAEGSPVLNMAPAWSPDGGRITFVSSRDGAEMEIYAMNADGTDQARLTHTEPHVIDHTPSFSPDGGYIVFQSDRAGYANTEIYRMRADGTDVQRLTETADGIEDTAPEYSPDGSRILFSSTRGGAASDLYTMGADGGDVRRLVGEPGLVDDVFGRWTPDGDRVMYQNFGTREPYRDSVWIVDADGSDRKRVSSRGTSDYLPDPMP